MECEALVSKRVPEVMLGIDWMVTHDVHWHFGSGVVDIGEQRLSLMTTEEVEAARTPMPGPRVRTVGHTAAAEPRGWSGAVLREATGRDPLLATVRGWLERGERPSGEGLVGTQSGIMTYWSDFRRLRLDDGVIYRAWYNRNGEVARWQVVLPASLKREVLEAAHVKGTGDHVGVASASRRVQRRYFWSTWMGDVWRHVRTCRGCSHGLRRRNGRQEMQGSVRRCRNVAPTEAVTPAGADNEPEPGPAEAATTDPSQVGGGPSDPESLNPNGAGGARSRVRLDNPNSPSPSTPVTARQPAHDNVPIRVQPRRNAPKPRRFLQSLVFVNSKRLSADRS